MEQIQDLQEANRCIRELSALALLPSIWSGGHADQIRENLADAVQSSLRAEVVFLRPGKVPGQESGKSTLRVKSIARLDTLEETLEKTIDDAFGPRAVDLIELWLGDQRIRLMILPLGIGREFGALAAGSFRDNFPTAAERILLNVAVNQATVAFRSAAQVTALRRSESDLRDFFENATLGLHWVDSNGIIVWANRAELKLLGYSREEYIGHNITEFHADGCVIEDILARLTRGETLHEYEARLRCKDGSIRQVLIDSSVLFENGQFIHTRCFTRDISEQKKALEAVAASERELRVMADSIPQMAWMARPDGYRFWFNRRWFEYTGTAFEQVQGWGWQCVHDPELLPTVLKAWNAAIAHGEPFELDLRLRGADGSYRWFLTQVNAVRDAEGRVTRWFGTNTDVDEVRQAQQALQEAQAELQRHAGRLEEEVAQRTAQLRETIQELEAFSYSISHDMRAPLRAMQGYSDALLEEYDAKLDDTGREYLRRIRRSSARMDLLIQDVLAYSRVAKGEIQMRAVDVESVIKDVIQNYPALQSDRAEIIVTPGIPRVCAHEAYLTQIISNLLTNAVKFVAQNQKPCVKVYAETEGDMARLIFEDNGIGIAQSHQKQIFQIFGRVYPEKKYEGTGIGLAIVKKAAERMGGAVGFESELGHGSKFFVRLHRA